jgi:FkbM family methyltransferase
MLVDRIVRRIPSGIKRRLVKCAQRRLRQVGYSLVAAHSRETGSPNWDVWDWVAAQAQIRTIIDIGANDGEYGAYLHDFFAAATVHAFEPLASSRASLESLRGRIPGLTIHPVALSDESGTATFFENAFGPASSLLRISDEARRSFPETDRAVPVTVPLARLDDVLPVGALERDIFIKIDVQGAEDRVIRGGQAVFSAASVVLIEMSFAPFYEGQPLFGEIHQQLEACGLRMAGFKNQINDPGSGRPLFAHCLYVRREGHQ